MWEVRFGRLGVGGTVWDVRFRGFNSRITCFVDTRRPADSLDTLKQKDDDDEGMPSQH